VRTHHNSLSVADPARWHEVRRPERAKFHPGAYANEAHTMRVSWLLAAIKVAEMRSPQGCPRCGAIVPANTGWCGECGLSRGATAGLQAAEHQPNPASVTRGPPTQTPSPGSFGPVCAGCGAKLDDRAYWCERCGQSRISLAITPVAPAASRSRRSAMPVSRRLSASAMAGIGAFAGVLVIVLAALGGGYGAAGILGAPSASPTTARVGAAGGSPGASDLALASAGEPSASEPSAGEPSAGKPSAGAIGSAAPLGSDSTAAGSPVVTPTTSPGAATATPAAPTLAAPTLAAPSAGPSASDGTLTVDITGLPDTVSANATTTLVATTAPGASCQAKVKFQSGKPSTAPGLAKKQTADATGKATWTWIVDPGTTPGTSTATVTCSLNGMSGSKSKDFVVG